MEAESKNIEAERIRINAAKSRIERNEIEFPFDIADLCAELGYRYHAEGHRGDSVLAMASQALAALNGEARTSLEHVRRVARLALQHRLIDPDTRERLPWSDETLDSMLMENKA